jgi:hypothetical protein
LEKKQCKCANTIKLENEIIILKNTIKLLLSNEGYCQDYIDNYMRRLLPKENPAK